VNKVNRKIWNGAPVATRLYFGRKEGVVVRENGTSKPLHPNADPDGQGDFSWGSESPAGKRLAMALLRDALEDEKRASELADIFNARVISILPERWTLTRERILSYTDIMAREQISDLLLKSISSLNSESI
jgi:Family of unknown function (DUF6166)